MELQRNLIMVALAIVSYLLLMAWMEDYANQPTILAHESSPSAPVFVDAGEESVVPDVTNASPAAMPQTPAPTNAPLVTVLTDTQHIVIDLRGGDIVQLRLPTYPDSLENPDKPFTLLDNNTQLYFVAQSGLTGMDGVDQQGQRARYRSEKTDYRMQNSEPLEVVLETDAREGVTVQKIYTFFPGQYRADVRFRVKNDSATHWSAVPFASLSRDASADPSRDDSLFGMPVYLGAAWGHTEAPYNKSHFDDIAERNLQESTQDGWVAMLQHYFVSAWVPEPGKANTLYSRHLRNAGLYLIGTTAPALSVPPATIGEYRFVLYAGPKVARSLEGLAPGLDLTVDYGWLWMVAQPLYWLLDKIHDAVGNWGLAIILLTVIVKLVFFHLSATSYRSMAKMRKVTPELTRIRDQYKNDRQKLSAEMMDLYRREKINPLGGCLPILVQMPVFIALYYVLLESVELRQAPFMLWIDDLSRMDPYFVLPLLMGASMWVQMHLNPAPPDPMQAKIMKWMPVVFTMFFLFFPSGLVLYWLVNNLLSIAQQYVITRSIENGAV